MLMVQAWDADGKAPAGWGSHIAITWSAFEPAAGVYRLDHFRRALACRERPCYVQLVFSMFNKATGVPEDYTPTAS